MLRGGDDTGTLVHSQEGEVKMAMEWKEAAALSATKPLLTVEDLLQYCET